MTVFALLALASTHYLTVAGLGGEPDYELRFHAQATEIDKLVKADATAKSTLLSGPAATKANVLAAINRIAGEAKTDDSFILTLIGHGTFDGADYKINLPGPDVTATDLAAALQKMPAGRQMVVNLTSASGAALAALQKTDRVVVSATKSGMEKNATVFPRYWVEALRDPAADADKNDVVTALEAFRFADKKTVAYYETQKRLATEHALLEDQGTGEGVRAPAPENGKGQIAGRLPLIRIGAAQRASADPAKQSLLQKREEIEVSIDKLKYQKAALPAEQYKRQMQALLLELAKVQEEIDK